MKEKIPFGIAILGMVGGVFIAILFGVNEDFFKNRIASGLAKNQKIQSLSDPEAKATKLKAEAEKNWRYYQRFHFHSTGIGAMSLSLLIFLSFIVASAKWKLAAAYLTSTGGFFYPFIWLFAAIYGPIWGRGEAKEAFAIFGYMGGLFLLGAVMTLVLGMTKPLRLKLID